MLPVVNLQTLFKNEILKSILKGVLDAKPFTPRQAEKIVLSPANELLAKKSGKNNIKLQILIVVFSFLWRGL